MSLADKIAVNTRYTRSINLERDRGSLSIVQAYLPTSRGIRLLEDIRAAFGTKDRPRAWSLIGPYGCGKSSFGLFLHELLGDNTNQSTTMAANRLRRESRILSQHFHKQKPWCRVVLTGSEEPLLERLLAALDEAGTEFWNRRPGRKPAVLDDIRKATEQGETSDSQILGLIDALQDALEKSGAGGLLIVIDELGKFLEHEARQGAGGVFLLQGLAERAFRGRQANLMLVVLLHQAFDLYARGLSEKLRNDWAKVQGRFESISFVETTEQTLRIVAAAFSNSLADAERESVSKRTTRMARALNKAGALPSALDVNQAAKLFAACYPLHPISLLLLPVLCQRFAQNERTLFSYLGSREPHGFGESVLALKVGEWVQPSEVYDYFLQNQPAVLADPITHRRWAEVATAVDRAEREAANENKPSLNLIKTIGLLNLASSSEAPSAAEGVLSQLFASKKAFREVIEHPLRTSVVQYRKFSDEYRVWQGTDFDIDEHTRQEEEKLGHFELAAALSERVESLPIVARRHSIKTGSLRYFNVAYVDVRSHKLFDVNDNTPRLVFFLAESQDDEAAFHQAREGGADNDLWVLHRNGAALRSVIRDALALEGVQRGAQELASDPVAAREVKERLKAAQATERKALHSLTREPTLSDWHWSGEKLDVPHASALQETLSKVMDSIYHETPTISNELINRDRLSSQAAAARNKLFQHMLNHEAQPNLSFEKHPPEKAIYRSVLESSGLHSKTEAGWAFVALGEKDPLKLRFVWNRLDALFAASETNPVSTDRLMDELAAPPIGLKRGVFPIIFLHYYLVHQHEIALYDEGAYSPRLKFEHLERMMRRPDLFGFQRFRIEGVRATLFNEYSKALFTEGTVRLTVLGIAKPLTQFVLELDDYTQKTRRLSPTTLQVRQAFFLSKSPEKLLFDALPKACGFDASTDLSGFADTLINCLRELKNAYAALLGHMQSALCGCAGLPDETSIGELRALLPGRYRGLDEYTVDIKGLKSFIRRLTNRHLPDDEWLDGILTFLGHKPPAKWTDQDRDTAEYRLAEFSRRLVDLEKLRLHYESVAQQDGEMEVILLKTLSKDLGEVDEIVPLTKRTESAIASARERIEGTLASMNDDDLSLALIASVAQGILSARRPQQSASGRKGELREVG